MTGPIEERRPDYEGDGYDPEPLLTAGEVAEKLQIPRDRVYQLELPRVRISERCVRWRPKTVQEFIEQREKQS